MRQSTEKRCLANCWATDQHEWYRTKARLNTFGKQAWEVRLSIRLRPRFFSDCEVCRCSFTLPPRGIEGTAAIFQWLRGVSREFVIRDRLQPSPSNQCLTHEGVRGCPVKECCLRICVRPVTCSGQVVSILLQKNEGLHSQNLCRAGYIVLSNVTQSRLWIKTDG